jgi:hypothetical protein
VLYTILPNADQSAVPAYLTNFAPPVAIGQVDYSFTRIGDDLTKLIAFTARSDRRLTLAEQSVFERALRRSGRLRQIIQL